MAQATQAAQTQRATGELLLAGTIAEAAFAAFIQTYNDDTLSGIPPETPTLMLLEAQPHGVIEREAQQDLLRFSAFDPACDFTLYTAGRIFHALGELRWERQHSDVQIVYTGHKHYKPHLHDAQETGLDSCIPQERKYFLFGKRLDQQQLDRIGPAAQQGDFAEVRIPRLLRYPQLPSLANAGRVQLAICEYVDPATAINVAYRVKGLVRFPKQSETTGAERA